MHNPGTNVAVLSILFSRSVGHTERIMVSRMSFGNWSPVRPRWPCSKISQAWMVCARSSIWAAFGGDKICLLSSRLLPAADGSLRAANLRHWSKPGSRSASSDNFWSFSFRPRDQEMLQFLVHLIRHTEFVLKVCHSNRLLLVLCGLHRLLQRHVHHADGSLSPDTTKFSSSGRFSFRSGRASESSVPPTGRATSYRPFCGV